MRFNRKQFFDSYRKAFGPLRQLQVDGLEFLLGKIEQDPEWDSLPQIAYFLATIKHETGVSRNRIDQTFQPIKELRERPGTAKRRNQDRYWLSGYYGRGYIQLTWEDNYAKFGLAEVPDDALRPDTAYMVAARGIREGKFTKYKLADFINDQEVDYFNARRVVNGLDKAEKIAEEAQKFERILRASVTEPVAEEPKGEASPVASQPKPLPGSPPPAAQVDNTIPAIPPLIAHIPEWAKKVVGWGAGINVLGLGGAFAFFRDNPQALAAALHILKWTLLGVGIVVAIIVAGVFVAKLYFAKLSNDLNMERLRHFSNPDSANVDFSGWKGQGEVKS